MMRCPILEATYALLSPDPSIRSHEGNGRVTAGGKELTPMEIYASRYVYEKVEPALSEQAR